MLNKPITSIFEDDLNELIVAQIPEGKTIDYKRDLPGNSDDKKKEFLADVASFANTAGGFLIYGMNENQGFATGLPGLSDFDPDKEKLRLESIIRDGIAPRIAGILFHHIQLVNGKLALIVYIPKSWVSPHMVIFQKSSRFYARASAGKYLMDVQEIRQAFALSETTAERIRAFRIQRISQIGADEAPVHLIGKAKLAIHIIPLSSFQSFQTIDFAPISSNFYKYFINASSKRFNIDGLVAYQEKTGNMARLYYQIFRNGIVEFVSGDLVIPINNEQGSVPSVSVEEETINVCENVLNLQKACGIEPPIYISVSMIAVKGLIFATSPSMRSFSPSFFDRDYIFIPEVALDNYPSDKDNLAQKLKPIMDALWNAAGLSGSPSFNNDGLWRPRY